MKWYAILFLYFYFGVAIRPTYPPPYSCGY